MLQVSVHHEAFSRSVGCLHSQRTAKNFVPDGALDLTIMAERMLLQYPRSNDITNLSLGNRGREADLPVADGQHDLVLGWRQLG